MKLLTIAIKDELLDHIIKSRNEAFFELKNSYVEKTFGVSGGLVYSFLSELQDIGMVRKLSGCDSSSVAFTISSLDTFYENGGFAKQNSIKNLLEDKLLYEVNDILKNGDQKEKPEILKKVKGLLPMLDTCIALATFVKGE
ncbi:hypothetical protein [Dyadobacter sp. CY312]|uniref:hypothetical protein n=1 Tax=Dyadobacter sp. CY312 TaxID=2907303 RepID=UPI001F323382|nr:hypothetical protein [Dyadobacter sp. CY312]MCE7042474.1 hypothetical protein [Dyadobacter sp. CY312]